MIFFEACSGRFVISCRHFHCDTETRDSKDERRFLARDEHSSDGGGRASRGGNGWSAVHVERRTYPSK